MDLIIAAVLFLLRSLGGAVSRQLNDECKAWTPWIIQRIIQNAVARLPQNQRERFAEEWRSHVNEVPGEVGKLFVALGFFSAARKMTAILNPSRDQNSISNAFSRTLDLILSATSLLTFAPVLLLTTLVLRFGSAGRVLAGCERIGLNGRKFKMYKFRTQGRLGRFLYNVLRGDMAIVGPRADKPNIAKQISRFIPRYSERTRVKPGISGWSAVNFRAGASIEEELALDLFYVENHSWKLDLLILVRTPMMALGHVGILRD